MYSQVYGKRDWMGSCILINIWLIWNGWIYDIYTCIYYGSADFSDNSRWNYKRPVMQKFQEAKNIYNCSRVVCSNART